MLTKAPPFSKSFFEELAQRYGTPLYVYDEAGIRQNARVLKKAFWRPDYINYFAVKATPTPAILRILADEGMGFDCSSRLELTLVEQAGLAGSGIFYTSNNTPDEDYCYAQKLGATINLDKLAYLEQVLTALPQTPLSLAIRYTPNLNIGQTAGSKFGDTAENVLAALVQMKTAGVERIGLHAMLADNEQDPDFFETVARELKTLAETAKAKHQTPIDFINIGGGVGINYHPDEPTTPIDAIGQTIGDVLGPLDIPVYSECGRYLTGPHGYLLTAVSHGIVESNRKFLTVDTSINNLNRLIAPGNDHHISLLGRETEPETPMTVIGSMMTNADRLFEDRLLPAGVQPGDLLLIHDAGAHGRANSTNYNGLPRCGEVLVRPDKSHCLIRRHERLNDLLATTKNL